MLTAHIRRGVSSDVPRDDWNMTAKIEELATAKRNVRWLLDHSNGLVDMKGLAYWARRVETLRAEVASAL